MKLLYFILAFSVVQARMMPSDTRQPIEPTIQPTRESSTTSEAPAPAPSPSDMVEEFSFEKPFEHIGVDGVRRVSSKWQQGGHTMVNRHFARLTPDRAGKVGWLWNTNVLGREEFSAILTFRISGQHERWFGDGIAMWLTTARSFIAGPAHGFMERFKGIGIVFKTFVNPEHRGGHKDISVFINDETRSFSDILDERRIGCDVPGLRYHEGHAGFDPSKDASRAKLQFKDNTLKIAIDAHNSGEWKDCVTVPVNALGRGWIKEATVGLTASTGNVADNHDILGLAFYDSANSQGHQDKDEAVKEKTQQHKDIFDMGGSDSERIKELQRQFQNLQEAFEHKLERLQESTDNTISKLKIQEKADMRRIEDLEYIIMGKVNQKVQENMNVFTSNVDNKLKQSVDEGLEKATSWKIPFLFIVVAVGVGAYVIYRKYNELRKSHLL